MRAVKPYYFLSQSQLAHFESWLQSVLTVLAKRWWPDISHIKVTTKNLDGTSAEKSVRYIYQLDDSYLLIGGSDKHWINAASGWLSCDVDQSSPLTKELEVKYCRELVASLDNAWQPRLNTNHWDAEEIITTYSRPGSGGISVEITVNNFSYVFLTTAAAFPTFFAMKDQSINTNLINVANALRESTVTLEARLAAVQVPLMSASALRVGDFIDLGHDLSGEILLNGIATDISLKAELGKCGNNKAAQTISVNRK